MLLNILGAVALVVGCGLLFGGLGELWSGRRLLNSEGGENGAIAGVGAALIVLAFVVYNR